MRIATTPEAVDEKQRRREMNRAAAGQKERPSADELALVALRAQHDHGVLDDGDQNILRRLAFASVTEDEGDVVRDGQGLPHLFRLVLRGSVEAVERHDVGEPPVLEVVQRGEGIGDAAGVDQDGRAHRALMISSHMNQKRVCPGVPNRYRIRSSAMVIRPKSMATVVVPCRAPLTGRRCRRPPPS